MTVKKAFCMILLAMTLTLGFTSDVGEQTVLPAASVEEKQKMLIPSGYPVGITLESRGLLVIGTGNVNGCDRRIYAPAQNLVKEGDIILEADGIVLSDKESLVSVVENSEEAVTLTLERKNNIMEVSVTPVKCLEDGNNKIGVWVRDSTQGIGTLTYVNPENSGYGALGHGVYDADTGDLMSVKSGMVVQSNITGIRKSEKGIPGELMGTLKKSDVYGSVDANTEYGIYGKLNAEGMTEFFGQAVPVAHTEEIQKGDAVILCSDENGKINEYKISIEEINTKSIFADKGMTIKITDERLKNSAGGIVQGMSGSPILQKGKLIGAVTHVFIKEPEKGYGIFIENMLEAAE